MGWKYTRGEAPAKRWTSSVSVRGCDPLPRHDRRPVAHHAHISRTHQAHGHRHQSLHRSVVVARAYLPAAPQDSRGAVECWLPPGSPPRQRRSGCEWTPCSALEIAVRVCVRATTAANVAVPGRLTLHVDHVDGVYLRLPAGEPPLPLPELPRADADLRRPEPCAGTRRRPPPTATATDGGADWSGRPKTWGRASRAPNRDQERGAPGEIRTHTGPDLNRLPLPLGYGRASHSLGVRLR